MDLKAAAALVFMQAVCEVGETEGRVGGSRRWMGREEGSKGKYMLVALLSSAPDRALSAVSSGLLTASKKGRRPTFVQS